ncbi:FAD-binding domain-containing family protein [Tripterygium wilfordii]|uniref:FAD-binding domain-containing family protein n=1 Tax=Tripterygium wilfordii TaxID=458696 RepID=A0A7J7D2F5_TRIWF|nr:berberine bridge enzyme-like 4 [Tripterygium wilfordii]KAF5740503.1 FAD-binding domain-containing family protein [Tripterygium wilfordii]
MKGTISLQVLIFSIFFFSVSWAIPTQTLLDNFLQCLTNQSNSISNAIYIETNPSFESVLTSYIRNKRFTTLPIPKPLAIITALEEPHVQATVVCAKTHLLQLRIRSGGHDYEGLSFRSDVPFVIIDMFNLRSIDIELGNASSSTAWAQAGATLGELYYKIANTSNFLGFPAGVCPTVGLGGHISGGGYGNMMRKYGLSVDNVIDARIVDVNGRILDRKSMGEDLFWAIRGGGGASFGVILAWQFKLVPVPGNVTVFRVHRNLAQNGSDIVYRWQQVASLLPDELFIRVMPQLENGTVNIAFIGFFLGQANSLLSLMQSSFPELGLRKQDCHEMRWVESLVYWAEFPTGTSIDVLLDRAEGAQDFTKLKSDYVKKPISKQGLENIWKMMISTRTNIMMQWNPYGGIMNKVPETALPFPHRSGNLFKIWYAIVWTNESDTVYNENVLRWFYEGMTPYVSKSPREAFQNYRDNDIGSGKSDKIVWANATAYGTKYFKNNFWRLTHVKAKVDPSNFFIHEQSIPPAIAHI